MSNESPTDRSKPPILLIGASVRAAAFSALRAGFAPIAADLFVDTDLARIAVARRITEYPGEFRQAASSFPAVPCTYTGGLENDPELIDDLAADRPLWGNDARSLRRARDPLFVRRVLEEAGLPALDVRPFDAPPRAGEWLLKRRRGSGGSGVRVWGKRVRAKAEEYFQRRAKGPSFSAVFVAGLSETVPAGVTQQFVGLETLGARSFCYCGSVGPVAIPSGDVEASIRRTGAVIAEACGLRGLFGIDFVYDGRCAWPVEVNPRYTASVEVLELGTGRSLFADHCRAFGAEQGDTSDHPQVCCVAKAILFAPREIAFRSSTDSDGAGLWSVPELADVPLERARIRRGDPVCTLFGAGESPRAAIEDLSLRHALLCRALGISTSSARTLLEDVFRGGYHFSC